MTQYPLTIYQPDGGPPPPEVLERVGRDAARAEPGDQGGRRLGLQPAGCTRRARPRWCARASGERAHRPTARTSRARSTSAGFWIVRRARPRRGARLGAQGRARDHAADRGAAVPGRPEY